ncbi:hypothetical protein [Agathobacter sp.]
MIELFKSDEKLLNRNSSKGNQLKWNNSGIWYKADYTGYEGLAEFLISHLLECSSLDQNEFVVYEPEQIRYKSSIYNGVKSRDFLYDDWQIITLDRLFHTVYGKKLSEMVWHIHDVKARLEYLVQQVERLTGLRNFGIYMNKLLTIDALFLNEDRHMHNIAVLMNGKGDYSYCPVFDNGAALLSDTTMDYPLGDDVYDLMKSVKAKTVSRDFDEQLDVSDELYGCNLHFVFSKKEVKGLLDQMGCYDPLIRKRVETVVYYQMDKYSYLFNK